MLLDATPLSRPFGPPSPACGRGEFLRCVRALVLLGTAWPFFAFSATNQALNVSGGSVALQDSAAVTITSTVLPLLLEARDSSGNVLASNADVVPGQQIYFLLSVDNPTPAQASDLRLSNLLDETQFTYVAGSIETALLPSGTGSAALWSGPWTPLSDALGAPDDIAAFTDSGGAVGADRFSAGAVTGQSNVNLDLPGNRLRAFRFQVTVK